MENEPLVLDLLEWVAARPRSYDESMAAWRSSCPRLTIWEDSLDKGLLRVNGRTVHITAEGHAFLRSRGR